MATETPNPNELTNDTIGKPDRAMDALELAAVTAEKGRLVQVVAPVAFEDVRAALRTFPVDVRLKLDRVMMGVDPELGLDALLESGTLRGIFPEVHAMVGF